MPDITNNTLSEGCQIIPGNAAIVNANTMRQVKPRGYFSGKSRQRKASSRHPIMIFEIPSAMRAPAGPQSEINAIPNKIAAINPTNCPNTTNLGLPMT